MVVLKVLAFLGGLFVVAGTVLSATRTFVLPRAARVLVARLVFVGLGRVFRLLAHPSRPYEVRDGVMALYAPISLIVLAIAWLTLLVIGFAGMLWAAGVPSWREAFVVSGSSLLTLGFEKPNPLPAVVLTFFEAGLGLGLVALLIAYLPSIYAAFSRRETAVSQIEPLAGSPPSPLEMLLRHHRILGLGRLEKVWTRWQEWFADIEESHTSLAALVFFRSPEPDRSWVTAAGCVMDTAALAESCLDQPQSPEAQLCIRAGYVALRRIADFFAVGYDPDPRPEDPISIHREEFDTVWDTLAAAGVRLKPDRDRAWRDYAGWRVNYDTVLLALAGITMAPLAPWSSDRAFAVPPAALSRRVWRRRVW